jgi:hypothetical protein
MGRYLIFVLSLAPFWAASQKTLQADNLRALTFRLSGMEVNTISSAISGSSTNVQIPTSAAVWNALQGRLSVVSTNSTLTGNGTSASSLGLAQQGASPGNLMGWNGSTWGPTTGNVVVENPTFLSANSGGSTPNGINLSAAGPSWGSPSVGPYMVMRGNNFSAFPDQRGAVYFVAGQPSTPVQGEDGRVFFRSPVGDIAFQSEKGSFFYSTSGALNFALQPSGRIVTKYGSGLYTGTPSRWLAAMSDGVIIDRTAREMSQETGNWGQIYLYQEPSDDPNNPVWGAKTYQYSQLGSSEYYTLTQAVGIDYSWGWKNQLLMPRLLTTQNQNTSYIYIRQQEGGVWGTPQKIWAGLADNIVQMGASEGQSLRWNGTAWTPTSGFSLSAIGELTSTALSGTSGSGDRLIFVDEQGKLFRSTIATVLQTVSTNAEFLGTGTAGSPITLFKPSGNKKNMVWDQVANRWIAATQPPVIISVLPFDHATACVVGIRSQGFFRVPQELDGKYLNRFSANLLGGQVGGFMGVQIKRYRAGSPVVNIGFSNIAASVNQFTTSWVSGANSADKQLQTGDLLQIEITTMSGVTTAGVGLNVVYYLFNNWDEI